MSILKEKCQVIILPTTNEQTPSNWLLINKTNNKLHKPSAGGEYRRLQQEGWNKVNLYITSNEEIQENDWIIDSRSGLNNYIHQVSCNIKSSHCKKIIAATNTFLTQCLPILDSVVTKAEIPLPQPSQGFIDKFIKRYNEGNPITDVLVEYEEELIGDIENSSIIKQLKISSSNTITIHSIKDSWSREEVLKLCTSARDEGERHGEVFWEEWIEKNI